MDLQVSYGKYIMSHTWSENCTHFLGRAEKMEHVRDLRIPKMMESLLEAYVDLVRAALPRVVQGVVLYGSISLDAFDPKCSDVDFVTLLSRELTEDELERVKELHTTLEQHNPLANRLDGFYIPVEDLQSGQSRPFPYFRESSYQGVLVFSRVARLQLDRAVTFFGPPVTVKQPEWQEIEREMSYNLNGYWADRAQQPELFVEEEWVAFAVLTFLRIRHTLMQKEIVSKKEAGEFAMQSLPERWHNLVAESLRIQYGDKKASLYGTASERAGETLQFMESMTEECNRILGK